ncbi:Solvent efflux pump periplasmic linker SrpA precursor [Thiorhodovibrio winogradskyi]|uniref:Solvent efflux pump periplasmic linker SrpA n=1 Tax=Thiorhodovibrio winogradskyi TaxID=77007 RepID=A0ABZ0SE01_9GAMM|nr:efflux RND transporter periplasmic adaptor subunit [Thiorhodovibrio winogradskyi]
MSFKSQPVFRTNWMKAAAFVPVLAPPAVVLAALLAALVTAPAALPASESSEQSDNSTNDRPRTLVEVAPVERARVERRIEATGTLRAPEQLMLKSRGRGRVAEVRFREGEAVAAGDTLLRLEPDRAEAAVQEAAAALSQAENEHARLQELSGRDFVSTQELEQAAAAAAQARAALRVAREDLHDRTLSAPFDGVIGERLVSPGELLEPNTPIARLQQLDPLDLQLQVPGTALGRIAPGAKVRATTPAYPDAHFDGELRFIAPHVDDISRTLRLEARLPNPERRLKPGLFMRAVLITGTQEILRVPEEAVVARGPVEHLFVVRSVSPPDQESEESRSAQRFQVERRTLSTGLRRDGWVEIRDGVSAGERVVVAGLQSLRDGRAVRIKSAEVEHANPAEGES